VYWSAAFTSKLSSLLDSIEKRFKLSKKFYKANSTPPSWLNSPFQKINKNFILAWEFRGTNLHVAARWIPCGWKREPCVFADKNPCMV